MIPWICPKCGKVWGPYVMQCAPCNAQIVTATNTTGWTPPIKRSQIEMRHAP